MCCQYTRQRKWYIMMMVVLYITDSCSKTCIDYSYRQRHNNTIMQSSLWFNLTDRRARTKDRFISN